MGRLTYCLGVLFPCCALTAVALVALAVAIALTFPALLRGQVDQKVTITPGHATFEQLQSPTLPVWKDIYFFNLTNPDEFQAGSVPNVAEIGPYSYRENRAKHFHGVSPDGSLLNYTQTKLFHFDSSTSGDGLKETDTICTINLPLVGAVAQLYKAIASMGSVKKEVAILYLGWLFGNSHAKLYVCQPASKLVWKYSDDLIHALHTALGLKLEHLNYPRDYISIQLNDSVNDTRPSAIYTGVQNISRIAQFAQWDGHGASKLGIWPGETANFVNGTEGLFFRPNLQEGTPLQSFVDDVVRSFDLVNTGKVTHLGLQALRYELPNSTFLNVTSNPANARWGSVVCPNGLIYLGPTQYPEVPVYGSKPRFLDGDPALREKVQGLLPPNRALHDTTIDVEPITGANIGFKRLLQVNVQVNKSTDFGQLEHIDGTLYYPILYIDEHAELTEDFKQYLESKGLSEVGLFKTLHWVFIALFLATALVCAIISLASCIAFLKKHKHLHKDSERRPLLDNSIQ